MADVRELRMELIFPKSTLARLTPSGLVGALRAEAEVGVIGVVVTAAVLAFVLAAFVGVVGTFGAKSDFVALETAADAFSFFSSVDDNNTKRADTVWNLNQNPTTGQPGSE